MLDDIHLNVSLLRRRVPNLTAAARSVGLRPATVSNLCTGKIPIARAEVRTLVALAELADCSLDDLIIHGQRFEMLETGVQVVDVFAPLVRGGTIGFVARQGVGQLVMLAELFHRMRSRGFTTVFWKPAVTSPGVEDVENESQAICISLKEVTDYVMRFQSEQDVLVAIDRSAVVSGELLLLQEKLRDIEEKSVTYILVDIQGDVVDEEVPYGPLDSLLKFDVDLAARGLYPAIDPIHSTSILLEGNELDAQHFSLQQRARKTLRRYRELRSIVQVHGLGKLSEMDTQTYIRGQQLETVLTQPFYVAEPVTKRPGEWISLEDSLRTVGKILSSNVNHVEGSSIPIQS